MVFREIYMYKLRAIVKEVKKDENGNYPLTITTSGEKTIGMLFEGR
jgi:hypothetical protein